MRNKQFAAMYDVAFPIVFLVVAALLLWLSMTFNARQEAIYTCEAVTYEVLFWGPETIEPPEWCGRFSEGGE